MFASSRVLDRAPQRESSNRPCGSSVQGASRVATGLIQLNRCEPPCGESEKEKHPEMVGIDVTAAARLPPRALTLSPSTRRDSERLYIITRKWRQTETKYTRSSVSCSLFLSLSCYLPLLFPFSAIPRELCANSPPSSVSFSIRGNDDFADCYVSLRLVSYRVTKVSGCPDDDGE